MLLDTLHRHEAHIGASHRLANGLGVSRVVLVGLDVGLDELRRHQADRVAHSVELACPVVGAPRGDYTHVRFVALPGRTYVIQYEVKTSWGRGTWRGWIEDETGATVSVPDNNRSSAVKK